MSGSTVPGTDSSLWYLGRATGVVSLLLLTTVVLLGILVRRGATLGSLPRFAVAGLHRNLALLSLVLLAIHVTTAVVDPFAPIRVLDVVVPFVSQYRPVWLGLGAAALDVLLAVVVTSLLRVRIGRRTWRAVHWLTVAAWPVALVHGLGTGTDTRQWWLLGLTAGCVVGVVAAALWRLAGTTPHRRVRAAAAALAVALPAALAGWLWLGPLAPNWAKRAGTPQALLAGHVAEPAATPSPTPLGRPVGAAGIIGEASRQVSRDGRYTLVLSGVLTSSPGGRLRLVLHGTASSIEGRIAIVDGSATLNPADDVGRYVGPVNEFFGSQFKATLTGPAGTVEVNGDVAVDFSQGAFTGSVTIS